MFRTLALVSGICLVAAACSAQSSVDEAVPANEAAQAVEEESIVTEAFEGLCRITHGTHVPGPDGGNRSTSSSNGTTITVMGSRSQSLSSIDGKATITVSGAAVLHLTFPGGEIASVETSPEAELVKVFISGPDGIACETVA